MTHETPTGMQALHDEIRAVANTYAVPAAPAPTTAVPDSTLSLEHPQRRVYALDDFAPVHQEAFVELAYRCLLKRAPDASGALLQLQRLADGDSKIAILGDLRWSTEGRGHAVRVRGLALRYRFWRMTRWPLVGGLIERIALLVALPEIAREQRRLGQILAQTDRAADTADLAVQVRTLREEVERLRKAGDARHGDPNRGT